MEVMLSWVAPPQAPPPPPKRELTPAQLEEIKSIFALYDKDSSGGITAKELKAAMKNTFIEAEEIDAMFAKADADENALLDINEFRELMVSTGLWDA
jgi:Ca2+-binding EF-hand superfamily protein